MTQMTTEQKKHNDDLRIRQTEILLAMKDTEIDSDRMCNLSGELDEIAGKMDAAASL